MIDLSEIIAADKRAREAWKAGRRDLMILIPRIHAYEPRKPMHSDSQPEGYLIYALPEDVNPKPVLDWGKPLRRKSDKVKVVSVDRRGGIVDVRYADNGCAALSETTDWLENYTQELRPLTGEELADMPVFIWVKGSRCAVINVMPDEGAATVSQHGIVSADWLLANAHYDRELTRPVGREVTHEPRET